MNFIGRRSLNISNRISQCKFNKMMLDNLHRMQPFRPSATLEEHTKAISDLDLRLQALERG